MVNDVINWEELDKITNCKRELAREMLAMLAAELPERQAQINAALSTQNWTQLREHIHKLHGSSAYCGTLQLRNAARDFEMLLKQNQTQDAAAHVAKINLHIAEFLETWQNYE